MIITTISYLSSVGISFLLKVINELKIYKYSADQGYKIDSKTLFKTIEKKITAKDWIILFVPIYNLVDSISECANSKLKYDLDDKEIFNPLSSYEDELYKKHPNAINAMMVPKIVQEQIEKSYVYEIFDENGYSKFHYFVDENNELHICKAEGYAEKLSLDEQTTLMIVHLFKDELERRDYENEANNYRNDYNFANSFNPTLKRIKK